MPLYGDGRHAREWPHVGDHCRAVRPVLDKGSGGETYRWSAAVRIALAQVETLTTPGPAEPA
ncbi:hypothetical protein [Streptosporangium canum]|uniref:hypothetical protein n=1 Tax=Streptosporangium canum TaxID=324952 RepID=UPI0037B570DD